MQSYHNSAVLQFDSATTGNAAVTVPVTVRVNSTQALVVIYDLSEVSKANPTATDTKGNYSFKAGDGVYDIIISEGTANEVKLEKIQLSTLTGISNEDLINDLSQTYTFPTVAAYKAFTSSFPIGKNIHLQDRRANFLVVSGVVGANDINIIDSDLGTQSIDLILTNDMQLTNFGSISGVDDTALTQTALDIMNDFGGGTITAAAGTWLINMEFGNGVNVPSNVHLIGVGDNTILKGIPLDTAFTGVHVISFVSCVNAKISRLKIDASKPSGSVAVTQWHGVKWNGDTDKCALDDLTIINGQGDGVLIAKEAGLGVVPQRGTINNVRVDGFNRQDISLVEGQGFTITDSSGSGVLDIESDASNRTNDNHYVENNDFNKIRISPLTGLAGTKTNNIVTDNRCNELSLWGGDGDVMLNNIVKGPIVLSQSGKVTIRGGSCYYFDQNVTNSTSVQHLIVDALCVESSTELLGFEIKDVIKADIKANITMTAVGSIGFQQNNNSTQVGSEINIHNSEIQSDSHSIDLTVVGLGDTKHNIKGNTLKSANGRSISKIGASSQGEMTIEDNDIYAQPVVRNCTKITSRGNRYHGVSNINYDFNDASNINLVDETYIDTAPAIALGSNAVSGSILIRDCKGENVVMTSSLISFSGTTATDVVIDGYTTNSDTPYSGLTATVRTGSKTWNIGQVGKYGRWYNGAAWADLT